MTSRGNNPSAGVLLAVVLLLAIEFLLFKPSQGREENPAARCEVERNNAAIKTSSVKLRLAVN